MDKLLISGFKRVNENISPDKLPADELVSLGNMRLDEEVGAITTRKGFSKYHAQVDTTGNIHSLFDVVDSSNNNYLLAGIKTKLRKSANGTGSYSDLKTGLTQDAKLRMAPYGGKFIFTNGVDEPFYTDISTVSSINLEIPDVHTITLATSLVGGGMSDGWYRYALVYLTADGQRSNPSNWLEVYLTTILDTVTISNIATPSDSRVVGVEIYRTPANAFTQFYLLTTLGVGTSSFVDSILDKGLNSNFTIQYMTKLNTVKNICTINDRIFLANFNKTAINRVIAPPQSPRTVFTESSVSPQIDPATYYWAFSYIDSFGNESALVHLGTHTLTATKNVILQDFPLPYIALDVPSLTYTVDPNIKFIRFYRTKGNPVVPFGGTDYLYYKLADFPIVAVGSVYVAIFTDNKNDSALTVLYPASTVHNPTETISLRSSVVFSNLFHYMEYPELNYIEVYPDDADSINVIAEGNNCVWIFKTNSICKIENTGAPENWYAQKTIENIGCDQPNSFVKYEDGYFFVYKKKPYLFSGSSLKLLGSDGYNGFNFQDTFNSITTFNGAAFYDKEKWYVLSVTIGTDYFLLCYDTKLDGWYKFSISKADSALTKIAGSDAGKLLLGGNLYVTLYDESAVSDTDTGNTVDISVSLTTKNYNFLDDFLIARLFMFYVNYFRKNGTESGAISFTINDQLSGLHKLYVDGDETQTEANYRIPTDKMTSFLQRGKKLNFAISGEAITKFYGMKLEYITENYGMVSK